MYINISEPSGIFKITWENCFNWFRFDNYEFVGSVFVLFWIVEMMQNCLRLVLAKCSFVRNKISKASKEVETNFAFVDEIAFIQ